MEFVFKYFLEGYCISFFVLVAEVVIKLGGFLGSWGLMLQLVAYIWVLCSKLKVSAGAEY